MKKSIFVLISMIVLLTACSAPTDNIGSSSTNVTDTPTASSTPAVSNEEEVFNNNMQAFLESIFSEGEKNVKVMSYGAFKGDTQIKESDRYVELKDKFDFDEYIKWTKANNVEANSEGKKVMKYDASCKLSEAEFKEFMDLQKEQNEKRKGIDTHKLTEEGKGTISIKKNEDGSYNIEGKEGIKYLKNLKIDKNGQRLETTNYTCMLSNVVKPEDNLKLSLNGFIWEDRDESFKSYDGSNYDAVLGTGYEIVMGKLASGNETVIFYSKMSIVNGESFTYSELITFE